MPLKITSLEAVPTIGIDIGRTTFHLIGKMGAIVLRQKWSRRQVEARLQLRNTNLKPGTDTPCSPCPCGRPLRGQTVFAQRIE